MIAKCQSEDDAKEALRRLTAKLRQLRKIECEDINKYPFDWSVEEARFWREGNQVIFQVYSAGVPKPIMHILEACAAKVDIGERQQALQISVKVPKGLNMKTAPLILGRDEVEALKLLRRVAGEPRTITRGNFDVWEWRIISELCYVEELSELFYGDDFCFKLSENWKVRLLGKTLNIQR